MSITDPMPRDCDADSPRYQEWYARERARIQANRERIREEVERERAAKAKPNGGDPKGADRAAKPTQPEVKDVDFGDKLHALRVQEGLNTEQTARRVMGLPEPVAAPEPPKPKIWDRANALRAQNPGMSDIQAMKAVQREDPETFARFQRGEDV